MLDILIPLNLLCRALNEPSLNFTLLFLLKAENYTTEKELNFEKMCVTLVTILLIFQFLSN